MATSPETVLKDLKQNKYAPVYFLDGDEPYYIDLIADYIEQHALSEADRGFNQMVMYGKDTQVNQVVSNARRFPMMAERQVVLVKEAQELQDLGKADAQKLLESYVQNPLPSTILVLCHKHKSFDKRKALYKALVKNGVVVSTKKLYDNQVPAWIEQFVKSEGHDISPKAVQMLSEFIGNKLERLVNEIRKILINFEGPVTIEDHHVQKFVGVSKEYNVFELQKAISFKDIVKANTIITYFAANPKDHPIIPMIALLYGYFSKLLIVHHSKDKSEKGLAAQLRINPYFAKEYIAASRNYSLGKVVSIINYLRQADLQSKGVNSGSATGGEIMKELIFKILH